MIKWEKFCWLWIWDKKRRKKWRDEYRLPTHYNGRYIYRGQDGCDQISAMLNSGKPCLVTRFGMVELSVVSTVVQQLKKRRVLFSETTQNRFCQCAGFFPQSDALYTRYACEALKIVAQADIMAAFNFRSIMEKEIITRYSPDATLIDLGSLCESAIECENPWTRCLENKRVLVIHPFEKTIRAQYEKRHVLFRNPKVLPRFELTTLKAVQGIGAKDIMGYRDWFDALDTMCRKIDAVDFDIALIGAGAYGMFLAHYVKKIGKQAIHTAGATQLLFGIKGHRWMHEQPDFAQRLFNQHWVFPCDEDTPDHLHAITDVEGSPCYW